MEAPAAGAAAGGFDAEVATPSSDSPVQHASALGSGGGECHGGLEPAETVTNDGVQGQSEPRPPRSSSRRARSREREEPLYSHTRTAPACTFGEVSLLLSLSRASSPENPKPTTAAGFLRAFQQRFGDLEYGWEAMDRRGEDVVNFNDFVVMCRSLNVCGNMRKLFCDLGGSDTDWRLRPADFEADLPAKLARLRKRRSPTPREPCPAVALPALAGRNFKFALLKKYDGRLDLAWRDIAKIDGVDLHLNDFIAACRSMSLSGNLKGMFQELSKGCDRIRPGDLDANLPKQLLALQSRNKPKFARERGATPDKMWFSSSIASQTARGALGSPKQLRSDAEGFKAALVNRFGSLETAWEFMDTNDDGILKLEEFVAACRHLRIGGPPRHLFEDIAGAGAADLLPDQLEAGLAARLERRKLWKARYDLKPLYSHGRRTLATTAAEVSNLIFNDSIAVPPVSTSKGFKAALIKKYGSLESAWEAMDSNGDGSLQFFEFVSGCRRIQFNGNLKGIFREIARDGELHMEDLDPILNAQVRFN
eukprot:TRINITY_DN26996_c0_g1_i2.p1 TRINITY_DN26996_c0_g1~~TRINITY_DN26996_c0_g1_i2.p1  ORF type:complete len:536 (-),score=89.06 TRINITY_DN26996_c0_g1_i2:80-1687(-)